MGDKPTISYTLTINATGPSKADAIALVASLLAELITAPDRAGYCFMNDRGSGEATFEEVNETHQ